MISPLPTHILRADDILFFIHIPKTAGTSMRAILDMHYDASVICPVNRLVDFAHFPVQEVKNYRLVRGHLPYNLSCYFDRPAVFMTLLRHPVERTISYYRFIQRLPDHPLYKDAMILPIVDFVAKHRDEIVEQTAYLSADFDERGMRRLVDEQESLALAKARLENMTFIGVMEAFRSSLHLLFYMFAWRPFTVDPELNRSPIASTRVSYTPEEISAIEELNAIDVELYHYGLLLFQTRYHGMLQSLFEHHYEQHNPTWKNPQTQIEIHMNQAFYGESWYDVEYVNQKWAYRWSGPAKVSSLDVGLMPNQSYFIEIHVLFAISDYILQTWQLCVHDVVIPLQRHIHPEVGYLYRGIIPAEAIKGRRFTRVEIVVNNTLRPSHIKPDSPDERDLGLAVASFKIQPIALPELSG